ncbi:MAG: alpha/beta hydrolase [Flavobacteriaceae bacterium]|nr:alpha/beta hydrolase [Flavobacteriaceae bacterium]
MKKDSNSVPNKHSFEIPQKYITTGKLLQFISTGLASDYCLKLFSTPPQFKIPEREEMMQKSAKTELVLIPGIEKKVMTYTYGYSKTKILLAHGWAGRGTQMYEIADKLLESGMMVISFDAPAHGLSEGKTTNLVEYLACITHINKTFGPFEAAIGHSFGSIALIAAQAEQHMFNKLVVIGTESSINSIIDEFVSKLSLKQQVAEKMKVGISKRLHVNAESYASDERAKKVSIPTLVVHDTEDVDVDVSSAFKIRQNLQNGLLMLTNGLGHRRILRDPALIFRIIDFIKE